MSKKAVDISYHNGVVDFEKVKQFIIIILS